MRRATVILALALLPLPAFAQTSAPHAAEGDSITRAQYVQRAAEAAGRRFDRMDTAHAGTLTREQIRAWRHTHGGRGAAASAAPAATE